MKNASHTALARKYRPQSFEELLGQPAVSVTLKNAIAAKRLHHAYLFTGPRGVGKTTMARLLAKALNCAKGPTPEPCGACDPCREIAASSALDVLEMDAASHTGVENVRQVIIETVALAPSRDRYKIFIIDEAHMLSTPAFNALLKTMEEPPPHVVFVLATTESAKVPATIASRCQRFRFRPVPVELLVEHLGRLAKKEKIDIEPGALELLARSAEGSLRDAVSLLDQTHSTSEGRITEAVVRDMFGFVPADMLLNLGRALFARDPKALGAALKTVYEEGVEPGQLLRDLRAALEGVYLAKLGLEAAVAPGWEAPAAGASAEAVGFLLRRMNKTLEELRQADSPRLTLELGLFGCLEAAADLAAWVERLERLEKRLGAAAPVPVAAPAPNPAGDPWAATVAALRQESESLGSALAAGRVKPSGDNSWTVLFASSYHVTVASKSKERIEAILATNAGRPIRLSFEKGEAPAAVEAVATAVESGPEPEGEWSDPGPANPPEPPAGLKKAQSILGGKVKIVKKPS